MFVIEAKSGLSLYGVNNYIGNPRSVQNGGTLFSPNFQSSLLSCSIWNIAVRAELTVETPSSCLPTNI